MPELPDIELYLHALRPRLVGQRILQVRVANPFLVRSISPSIDELRGRTIRALSRLGKRIVFDCDDVFLVVHLMIAGRFQWRPPDAAIPKKLGLMALDVAGGTLLLTEAGSTRRASLHVVEGRVSLSAHDPGGIDVFAATRQEFRGALTRERHTLKRSLTDPTLFSGIGNAYSDEILHRARLSPFHMSDALSEDELTRLFGAVTAVLRHWRDFLIGEAGDVFPAKVTAFREGMAVHGRYGKPCPVCGTPVQRIRYANNEANYCPTCQTGGRLLADRGLSRLLKNDWPRTLDDLERLKSSRRPG